MRRTAVESSVLRSVGYDPKRKILEAEFSDGDVYDYFGVPVSEYHALLAAESHGEYFNRVIKAAGYRFERK
jgi:hypothetical protein